MRVFRFFALASFVLTSAILNGQTALRGPDGGTTTRVSGVEVLNVSGKPFFANTSTEWTRTLEDGSTMTLHLDARLARDGSGRVYRERRTFVPAGSGKESRLNEIRIYDPVSRTQTVCNVHLKECVIGDYKPRLNFETRPEGVFDNGNRSLVREQLGANTIEGIDVIGTRETTRMRPGVQGNERELVSTREFWYSEELENNLEVTRDDPREGKQFIHLSGITAGEPDAQFFAPPAGFTIRDLRATAAHPGSLGTDSSDQ